jgi:hypothetical protein
MAWGVRNGIALAAIVLIPAVIASLRSDRHEVQQFVPIAAAYLAFGAFAGVLVGIARPRLAKKSVAVAVGALVGGSGFSILLASADPRGASRASLIAIGGLLGLLVGAFLGWWAWKRAGAWKIR